jgi:hypothetical protein
MPQGTMAAAQNRNPSAQNLRPNAAGHGFNKLLAQGSQSHNSQSQKERKGIFGPGVQV